MISGRGATHIGCEDWLTGATQIADAYTTDALPTDTMPRRSPQHGNAIHKDIRISRVWDRLATKPCAVATRRQATTRQQNTADTHRGAGARRQTTNGRPTPTMRKTKETQRGTKQDRAARANNKALKRDARGPRVMSTTKRNARVTKTELQVG